MSDDEPKPAGVDTRPPPPGEEDLYSAPTTVGQASAELLALVRATEEGPKLVVKPRPSERPVKNPVAEALPSDEEKLAALKEAASRSAKDAAANEVARNASSAPPAPTPSKKEAAPARVDPPARRPETEATSKRKTEDPRPPAGLPPVVTIVGIFAAAALVLAVLVR